MNRKLWTTRDLQDAAAAGVLVEDEDEEDFLSEEDDFVSEDEVEDFDSEEDDVVEDVLFAAPDRLSVR